MSADKQQTMVNKLQYCQPKKLNSYSEYQSMSISMQNDQNNVVTLLTQLLAPQCLALGKKDSAMVLKNCHKTVIISDRIFMNEVFLKS